MLPSKGRKEITINGTLYYYIVSGNVTVTIQNSIDSDKYRWHQEVKPKWGTQITPGDVKKIIQGTISYGTYQQL